jgi:hypothetical protein
VSLNTDRENSTEEVLLVYSSGSREAVRKFLWLKFLWSQLSREENLLFLCLLRDSDEKEWAVLRLLNQISKRELRRRLLRAETFLGQEVSEKQRLSGYYQLRIEITKETRRLPKVKKFSGYIKSPSAAGSKRQLVRQFLDEMVSEDEYKDYEREMSWYSLLSVESVSLFLGRGVIGS